MKNILFLVLTLAFLAGCSQQIYSEANRSQDKKRSAFVNTDGRTELIHFLREKPELRISNLGGTYEILIRGPRSINGPNTPLYTLDGVQLGRDYASVASTVDVNQIASVRVITPANAGIYGSQGQNGVIAIKTKN